MNLCIKIFQLLIFAPLLYSQSITVSDNFEGGNINVISINNSDNTILVSPALRPGDTKASYFYFKVKGYSTAQPFYIRLYTSETYYAPVLAGMSYDQINWHRVPAANYSGYKLYTLSPVSDSLYFAIGYPYTWSDMIDHVNSHTGNASLEVSDLCISEGGRAVKLLRVTDSSVEDSIKSLIWIIARQHAFETHSNYVVEGLIDELLSGSETSARLRRQSIIYIIPVMDVDNAFNGGTGKDQNPVDFNRDWDSPSYWNAVKAVKDKLAETIEVNKLEVFIDSHDPWPGEDNINSRLFVYALHDTGTTSYNLNFFRDVFEEYGGYPLNRQELYPTIGQTSTRYADSLYSPGVCFSVETGWTYRTDGVLWDINRYKNNGKIFSNTISGYINSLPQTGNIIIDNLDSLSVVITGQWVTSSNVGGHYGEDYIHDNNTGKGLKSVEFNPAINTTGFYEVFLRWTSADGRATNVPVKIYHAEGITEVTVNQEKKGAGWVSLGIYSFNISGLSKIKIETTGTNGYVIADAVRLSLRSSPMDITDFDVRITESFLFQNYPNPFNPETTIMYIIPEGNVTTLKIFDLLGRETAVLVNAFQQKGVYEYKFNLNYLPGGVYFYRLTSGTYSEVKKLIILK